MFAKVTNLQIQVLLLSVLVVLLVSGCRITVEPVEPVDPNPNPNPNPINPIEQLYKQNLLKWQNQNLDSYEFVFQRICFCVREVTRPARISVQQDKIESVRWVESYQDVNSIYKDGFLDIEKIFDLIESAIAENAATIEVDYDVTYGFPTKVYIDYDERIADEEVSIQATFLEATTNGPAPTPTSCEPYKTDSYEYSVGGNSDINFATLQVLSKGPSVNVCVRSQHTNGCVEAIEFSSSYKKGEFRLTKTLLPINTFVACTADIPPYAKLVKLDVTGLEPANYKINYFSSNDSPNPQITTSFDLQVSEFNSCLPSGITDTTVVSTSMSLNSDGQTVINKVLVLDKLNELNATCTSTKLTDATGKEIRFYQLIGCWGAKPDDADEQLAKQAADIATLEKDFNVITLTCNPGGLAFP